MQRTRTLFQGPCEQASRVGTPVRAAAGSRRLGWHQRLHQWCVGSPCAGHRSEVPRWLDDLWDAQHEHLWVQTACSYRDFIIKESPPAVRQALYYHLALF